MESEGKNNPEVEAPLVDGVAVGVNENNKADSSDNPIEPANESNDGATLSDDPIATEPPPFKAGDYVQSESNGILKLTEPMRLSHCSDDDNFALIEVSTTGFAFGELIAANHHVQSAAKAKIAIGEAATDPDITPTAGGSISESETLMNGDAADAETAITDGVSVGIEHGQANSVATMDPQAHEIESVDAITAEAKALTRRLEDAIISSVKDRADHIEADGIVAYMDIEQLGARLMVLDPQLNSITSQIADTQCLLGRLQKADSALDLAIAEILWYAKKRIQGDTATRGRNGGWTPFLRKYASESLRKSADRRVDGYTLYLESDPAIQAAVRKARVSPHTEMIAGRIQSLRTRVVNGELDPNAPEFEDICVGELRAKPPRVVSAKDRKRENRRKKLKPPMDPDPAIWTRWATSVQEAQTYCLNLIGKLPEGEKDENPLLVAFANAAPAASFFDMCRVFHSYAIRSGPRAERESRAEIMLGAAQNELDFIREDLSRTDSSVDQPARSLVLDIDVTSIANDTTTALSGSNGVGDCPAATFTSLLDSLPIPPAQTTAKPQSEFPQDPYDDNLPESSAPVPMREPIALLHLEPVMSLSMSEPL